MVEKESAAELQDESRLVDQELAELEAETDDLRRELGDRTDGAGDAVDRTTLITQLEAQEAVIEGLRARRDDLKRRLGQN